MNIILCVSMDNGISFNNRRVSRDKVVIEKIKEIVGDKKLYADLSAATLFDDYHNVTYIPRFLSTKMNELAKNDFWFVEHNDFNLFYVDKIYVFNWNRKYPADTYFDIDLEKTNFKLINKHDFKGNSHDVITLYEYQKED